jgi:hypothetical protein
MLFDTIENSSDADGFFVALTWQAWYNQGNPQGDEVQQVFIDNQPLGYWLNRLEERKKKVRNG